MNTDFDLDKIHDILVAIGFVKWGWIHYHEPPLLVYHYKKREPQYTIVDTLMIVINPENNSAVMRKSAEPVGIEVNLKDL